jgi:hypothetical protein
LTTLEEAIRRPRREDEQHRPREYQDQYRSD